MLSVKKFHASFDVSRSQQTVLYVYLLYFKILNYLQKLQVIGHHQVLLVHQHQRAQILNIHLYLTVSIYYLPFFFFFALKYCVIHLFFFFFCKYTNFIQSHLTLKSMFLQTKSNHLFLHVRYILYEKSTLAC